MSDQSPIFVTGSNKGKSYETVYLEDHYYFVWLKTNGEISEENLKAVEWYEQRMKDVKVSGGIDLRELTPTLAYTLMAVFLILLNALMHQVSL